MFRKSLQRYRRHEVIKQFSQTAALLRRNKTDNTNSSKTVLYAINTVQLFSIVAANHYRDPVKASTSKKGMYKLSSVLV